MAGHKDNHAGLMTPAQMKAFRQTMGVRTGHEWDRFEGLSLPPERLQTYLDRVPFAAAGARLLQAPEIEVPAELRPTFQAVTSTQTGFGALLNEIGRADSEFARRIVTTSPDVTVSTNLGGFVNRRGLFARQAMADTFKSERIPSISNWEFSPKGQHIELGIAEMTCSFCSRHSACRTRSMANGCCRSARCTIPSSRAVSMRLIMPVTRTRASSWWLRLRASPSREKAARISRSQSR
jgi:pyruvate dehydrogenase complex dehydrogenase (E1) component